jgi:hypothetical protein
MALSTELHALALFLQGPGEGVAALVDTGETGHRITRFATNRVRQWWRSALGDKPVERVAFVLVALGCVLRAAPFLAEGSLWLDEAMVADSIVHRDWAGLLQPLTYNQVAPLGWLMVERASFLVLGGSDLSLRAPALLAGIASLLLFARVARRSFDTHGFILAIAAFAISYVLVRYSAEVKPYGFDVLVSVVALTFATHYLQQDEPLQVRDYLLVLLAGLASLLVSFPAAFVLAGLGGALFLRNVLERRWAHVLSVGIVSSAWLFAFAWLLLRQGASVNVAEMTTSWNSAYAPLQPTSLGELKWYPNAIIDALRSMFEPESMVAWLMAIIVGAVVTIRSRLYLGVALLAPLAAALVASGLHLYPFSGRLLLFALPELLFLALVGVQAALSAFKAPLTGSLIAAVLLLYGPAHRLWQEFTDHPTPFAAEHVLPVMQAMSAQTDVDAVYVNVQGLPAFRYYQQRAGLAGVRVIAGRGLRNSFGCLLADIELVSRHRRVWVFYSHPGRVIGDIPDDVLFRYFADATGRRVRSVDLSGVHAHLYEFDEAGAQRLSAIRHALSAAGACNAARRSAVE